MGDSLSPGRSLVTSQRKLRPEKRGPNTFLTIQAYIPVLRKCMLVFYDKKRIPMNSQKILKLIRKKLNPFVASKYGFDLYDKSLFYA